MAVQVWIGEKPDNPNERKAIIALANGLDRLEGLYVMLANFSVGGRAIDLVILKQDAIFILELKHCDGKVYGSVNGTWKVVSKNGSTKQLNPGRKNPYGQVVSYFYNFTNFLNEHKTTIVSPQKANDIDFRSAKRVIVIVPTVEPGSEIELDWKVQVKGLDELPTFLLTERSNGIELTDEELLRIPRLLHCEPWQEVNDLIAGVMPTWADTPSEPLPLRSAPSVSPAPDAAPPAPSWWRARLLQINSWPGRVLTAFVVLTLFLAIFVPQVLLLEGPPSFGSTAQRASQPPQPIPTIPDIGLGENVTNNVAILRQATYRRWDSAQRQWVRTDAESADVAVTLETVDFNNGQIKLEWTLENRRETPARMALVPQNIEITDGQVKYQVDPGLSQPPGTLVVENGEKGSATVIVPQAVRPNAITLRITLQTQPFGQTSWLVNAPQQ